MLRLQDFQYKLSQSAIAQTPANPRDSSKLLGVNRQTRQFSHHIFHDLPGLLSSKDVLVLNDSRTIPCRTLARKSSGGQLEVLFVRQLPTSTPSYEFRSLITKVRTAGKSLETTTKMPNKVGTPFKEESRRTSGVTSVSFPADCETGASLRSEKSVPLLQSEKVEDWEVLSRPGLRVSQQAEILHSAMRIECLQDLGYTRRVRVTGQSTTVLAELQQCGKLPLPHYIRRSPSNPEVYQTVFSRRLGSSATPTAGLHFTPELLQQLQAKGVEIVRLTLHVGLGTFLPVKVDDISRHQMHAEWFEISEVAAKQLNTAKKAGKRIIAVGTTSLRTLESCVDTAVQPTQIQAQTGETRLYVYPPYQFKFVDALITNFHLPGSTLLMLVSAFCSSHEKFRSFTTSLAGQAYAEALQHEYRFFSFGDAMFIE